MAYLRPSLHESDGLSALSILLCPWPDTTINTQSYSNPVDHLLRRRAGWKGAYEKPEAVQLERFLHATQSILDCRQRDNVGALHGTTDTDRVEERHFLCYLRS